MALCQFQHEVIGREGNDLVGRFVIVEIVVVVLHKEDRRRTQKRTILRNDLRSGRAAENRLVCRTEHRLRAIEGACDLGAPLADQFGRLGRALIPIDLVAIAHRA